MSWTIYVHTVRGKTVTLSVKPSDTIYTVKDKICEQTGTRPEFQQLLYNGKHLDDDQMTLSGYHVANVAGLLLLPNSHAKSARSYEIIVKTLNGKSFYIQAESNDKIEDICGKIYKKEGIPTEQQQLIYGGKVLDWDTTLESNGIQRNSSLYVVCAQSQRKVTLELPFAGKTVSMRLLTSGTVDSLYKEIAEKFDVCLEGVYFNGSRLERGAQLSEYRISSDSVLSVRVLGGEDRKEKKEEKEGVQYPQAKAQTLKATRTATVPTVYSRSHSLNDSSQVRYEYDECSGQRSLCLGGSDQGLHRKSSDDATAQIYIRTLVGRTIALEASLNDTISALKSRIQEMEGVPSNQQQLLLGGDPLNDSMKLRDFNLHTESTFHLTLSPSAIKNAETSSQPSQRIGRVSARPEPMTIYIRNLMGKTITVEVLPTDTIRTLKTRISEKEGVLPNTQMLLLFQGRNLDDSLCIEELNIDQESDLHLVLQAAAPPLGEEKLVSIYIRTPAGKMLSVEVPFGAKVFNIKRKVYEMERIPPDQQTLLLNGSEVDDRRVLDSRDALLQSTFQLALKAPDEPTLPIFIKTPLGKTIVVNVSLSEKICNLKATICEKEGIVPSKQKLLFQGRELDDQSILRDSGIERESNMVVVLREQGRDFSVRMPSGKVVQMYFESNDTVVSVKQAIELLESIPVNRQNLVDTANRYLHDSIFVEDIDNNMLLLVLRPVSVSVLVSKYNPDIAARVIPVDGLTTVSNLCQQVRSSLMVPPQSCPRFFIDGKLLTNETCRLVVQGSVIMLGEYLTTLGRCSILSSFSLLLTDMIDTTGNPLTAAISNGNTHYHWKDKRVTVQLHNPTAIHSLTIQECTVSQKFHFAQSNRILSKVYELSCTYDPQDFFADIGAKITIPLSFAVGSSSALTFSRASRAPSWQSDLTPMYTFSNIEGGTFDTKLSIATLDLQEFDCFLCISS